MTALCLLFVRQSSAIAAGTMLVPGTEHAPEIRVPDGTSLPPDPAGAAICWKGEDGFMIRLPDGWQNLPESAAYHNVCFMGIPAGSSARDFPALLYPRIFSRLKSRSPADTADTAAEVARRDLARAPGGENISIRAGKSFVTPLNLPVEIRYFDNGPYPNVFEAVAYVVHDTTVLSLVLSAKTRDARDTFFSALLESARAVTPVQINSAIRPGNTGR